MVLTKGNTWNDLSLLPPGVRPGQVAPIWLDLQRDLTSLSANSTHRIIEHLTHTELIGPRGVEWVVTAVRAIVDQVRNA